MAKAKSKKPAGKEPNPKKKSKAGKASNAGSKSAKATKPAKPAKPAKAAKLAEAKKRVVELASNPVVAEVVAATLVAAAAALRDPKKAREIAAAAGDDIKGVASGAAGNGAAFWQLALDVARRSVDAMNAGEPGNAKKPKKSKK